MREHIRINKILHLLGVPCKVRFPRIGLFLPLFFIYVAISACALLGSPTSNPNLGNNPTLPASSSQSSKPVQSSPSSTSSQSSQSSNIELLPNYVQKSDPQNGWIDYSLGLAFRNNGSKSIQIYNSNLSQLALDKSLPTIVISTESSYVETQEGVTYPASLNNSNSMGEMMVPPGLLVNGFPNSFQFNFRVPEKLSPTNLVISPGIAFIAASDLENYVNNNLSPSFSTSTINIFGGESIPINPNINPSAFQQQPQEIQLSEKISASFPGDLSGELKVQPVNINQLLLTLSIPITNQDITQDRQFSLESLVVDQFGYLYQGSDCSDGLNGKLGPGQSDTLKLCFTLPSNSARSPGDFYISLYWGHNEADYHLTINSNNIVNCVPHSAEEINKMIFSYGDLPKQNINIPGETTPDNWDSTYGLIWIASVPANKDIQLTITNGNGVKIDFRIGNPDGSSAPFVDVDDEGDKVIKDFYSFCNGPYFFWDINVWKPQNITAEVK